MTRRSTLLFAVRLTHTLVVVVMSAAILYILYCGVFGVVNTALWVAYGLVIAEIVVFVGNGTRCPMLDWAQVLGGGTPEKFVNDIFLPRPIADRITPVCGTLVLVGTLLIVLRALL